MNNCIGRSGTSYGIHFDNYNRNLTVDRGSFSSNSNIALYGGNLYNSVLSNFSIVSGATSANPVYIINSTGNEINDISVNSNFASAPHSEKSIMVFGDSRAAGGIDGVWGGYTNFVGSTLNNLSSGWHVSNAGIGGDTTTNAKNRFDTYFGIYRPQIVTFMFGTNDFAGGASEQTVIDNILWMCNRTEELGATPIILLETNVSGDNIKARAKCAQNLSIRAAALGIKTINCFDTVDMLPLNGQYDSWNTTNYNDPVHPNELGNRLIGEQVAREIDAYYTLHTGSGLNATIRQNGTIFYNRAVLPGDSRLQFSAFPSSGSVNVTVLEWSSTGDYKKRFSESSENHDITVTHSIGGFPANRKINIAIDGTYQQSITSDTNGYINWEYSGGFSEHTFEMIPQAINEQTKENNGNSAASNLNLISILLMLLGPLLILKGLQSGNLSIKSALAYTIGIIIITLFMQVGIYMASVMP